MKCTEAFRSAAGVPIQCVLAGEAEGPGHEARFPSPSDPKCVTTALDEKLSILDIKARDHLIFELRDRRHLALFTDQMAVHILELPKFAKAVEELVTPLDRWMYFLRNARDLDLESLPGPIDVPELHSALGDLIMISQSKRDRELYESREKMPNTVISSDWGP